MLDLPVSRLRRSEWLGCAVAVCGIFFNGPVVAGTSAPLIGPFTNQYHTAWVARDGLPPRIADIAQTGDGFLWLASQAGLYRFDGVKFEPYASSPENSLLRDGIASLAATHDGGLWVGYTFGGASLIKDGVVTNYLPAATFNHNLQGIVEDMDGTIWGATHFGLQRFDGKQWARVGEDWNFPLREIDEMHLDAQGTLWVGTEISYYALRRGEKRFYDSGIKSGPVHIINDRAGWMVENDSLIRLSRSGDGPWVRSKTGIRGKMETLTTSRDGQLWIGTHSGVMRTATEPSLDPIVEQFRKEDGLSSGFVFNLMEDRESNIWVITAGGLDRFRRLPFNLVRLPTGVGKLRMTSLGDSLLVASGADSKSTLFKLTDKGTEAIQSSLKSVYAMTADNHGGAWVTADGGLWHYNGDALKPISPPSGG
jgi:ligand-binding sensor domain-containing protein